MFIIGIRQRVTQDVSGASALHLLTQLHGMVLSYEQKHILFLSFINKKFSVPF